LAGGLELALTTKGAFLADDDRETADCTGRPSSCRPERRAWAAMDRSLLLLSCRHGVRALRWCLRAAREERGAQKKRRGKICDGAARGGPQGNLNRARWRPREMRPHPRGHWRRAVWRVRWDKGAAVSVCGRRKAVAETISPGQDLAEIFFWHIPPGPFFRDNLEPYKAAAVGACSGWNHGPKRSPEQFSP
jgi:hypothetical protein